MTRFSANLGFLWNDRPLPDAIAAAAQAGFEAVELHWPYETPAESIRHACATHGVRLLALNSPLGDTGKGEFGLAALPGRELDFERSFDIALDYARRAGAGAIHVMAGLVEPGQRPAAREVFARNLAGALSKAGDLVVLLEPLNTRDKPGYFYSTQEEAASIIAQLGSLNLRLMFDVYHVAVAQGDVLKRMERHFPIIGHVQIAAVPSRAEPDEGEIAYGAIFEALERLGYQGWVGCEYRPRGDVESGLSAWRKQLRV